uniref:response regulator transcription factor n=2 Tax=Fischerella TaxID=1190 RepID=UPI001688BD5A
FEISRLIQFSLEDEGFSCHNCGDGLQAFQIIQEHQPNLIILDLMIPSLNGLELCARIRQKPGAKDPYILMLTAKSEEIDRIIGLSTGADDYLVKPFSPKELVARVRALLRRSLRQPEQHQIYRTQHFLLDIEQHSALRQMNPNFSEIIDLTNLEFNLLTAFVRYPNRVWNRTQLIDKLWGSEFYGDERVVDTLIARLRKKIEPDSANPIFIKTVTGIGYKFED